MNKLHILYILTDISTNGGVVRIVFDKINELIKRYDISVLYLGNCRKAFYEINKDVKFYNLPLKNKGIIKYFYLILNYKKLVSKINPDLIINANSILVTWIIPFLGKQKKILELHQSYEGVKIYDYENYGKYSIKRAFHVSLRRIIYPKYDKIVVLTNQDKEKWGGKNICVIPNFTKLKSETKYNPDTKNIIWVGRLTSQKGADILIAICDNFLKRNKDWSITIIGDEPGGEIKYNLLNYISNESRNNRIKYIKSTKEISLYYSHSSIYISTSRYEGLPLAMIEATSFGIPCIGFTITGNTDIIQNNKNGYLIRNYDIEAFSDALFRLSEDRSKRLEFSQNALIASTKYSKENILKQWISLIETLKQ